MFIELTDHLRCPADHPESFLVLLPDRMEGRDVLAGHLGCPVCGWSTTIREGEANFGGGGPAGVGTALTPEAVEAFLGLSGPGGYLAVAGGATALVPDLAAVLPALRIVAVNPAPDRHGAFPASVLWSSRLPLKTASMRGVVLGADLASDPAWVAEAVRVTLPGLRVVGEGQPPDVPSLVVMATGGRVWVGTRGTAGA